MVVALIALGVALGGSAVAGTGLITGTQIKDHSIGLNDLAPKAIAHLRGHRGPQGLQGPQGPQGLQGVQGTTAAVANQLHLVTASATVSAGGYAYADAQCPSGSTIISGGGYTNAGFLYISEPISTGGGGTGWRAGAVSTLQSAQLMVEAICLAP